VCTQVALRFLHHTRHNFPDLHWQLSEITVLQPFYSSLDSVRDHLGEPVPNPGAGTERNIHPLTPIAVIDHPFSASCLFYDPWHPPCTIYVPDSLFKQSLSKDAMVRSRWRKQIGMIDDHNECEWVNVSSGTGSPGLSWTNSTESKNGCVCVCVSKFSLVYLLDWHSHFILHTFLLRSLN